MIMQKIAICAAFVVALGFGVWADDAGKRVTVILQDNLTQQGGKRLASAPPPYEGDAVLKNAFATLQVRLQTMLVSSGRVDVKPTVAETKGLTEGGIFLCNYTLVQGRATGVKRGIKQEYILGINLQAWDYVTEKPLPELTRTVDLKLFEDTPENAFAFVTRYLAFLTLEAIAPVTVLEREDNTVSVSAGGELLKVGDLLSIRKGLKKGASVRVVETDAQQSIGEVIGGDPALVEVGSKCRFVLPDNLNSDTKAAQAKGGYVPSVVVKEVKASVPESEFQTYAVREKATALGGVSRLAGGVLGLAGKSNAAAGVAVGANAIPKDYTVERVTVKRKRADVVDIPNLLLAKLKTQNTGLKLLSFDGLSQKQIEEQGRGSDFELTCEIVGYAEEHTNGKFVNGELSFDQKGTLTANVTLVNTETKEVVGGRAFPVTAVCERVGVSVHALDSAGSLLSWDEVLTECVKQVADKIRESSTTLKN